MPNCNLPRTSVTPAEILGLFMRGVDTADIASRYGIKEHEAYKLLRFAMEARKTFNDPDRDRTSVSPQRK